MTRNSEATTCFTRNPFCASSAIARRDLVRKGEEAGPGGQAESDVPEQHERGEARDREKPAPVARKASIADRQNRGSLANTAASRWTDRRENAARDARTARNERVLLQGVEGELLSRGSSRLRDAPPLLVAAAFRRDQQHVLPDAARVAPRELGRAGSGRVLLRAEGVAADHAPQASEGGGRRGRLLLRGRRRRSATGSARSCSSSRRT